MKAVVHHGVKVLAAGVDLVRSPSPGLVVLIYHRVGGPGGAVDLSPERFEDQVAELAASGRTRTLDEGLDAVLAPADHPRERDPGGSSDPVVVTFDDGTVDFVEQALPTLVRHRVPALLYLATRFADEGLDFPGGGPAVSWAGLRDACSTGLVDIGSHTHSHVLLDRVPDDEAAAELDRSIDLIGHHLDRPVHHFAYPKAVLGSPGAEAAVRARFRSAAVAGTHANRPGATDPHRLARSPIQVADGMRWFRRKAHGGMGLEDLLRQRVNRARYAGATT